MNTPATFSDEVSAEDYAAVDKVLRKIDRENANRASLEPFAYWKLGFNLYRDLEFQYQCDTNRDRFATIHRAILTSILGATEMLESNVDRFDDSDLGRIGLSKQTFKGCARYLRRKYRQWYLPLEPKLVEIFESKFAGATLRVLECGALRRF